MKIYNDIRQIGILSDIKNIEQYLPNSSFIEQIQNTATSSYNAYPQNSSAPVAKDAHIDLSNWYISVSFGKSSSNNYMKAVMLTQQAPQYHTQTDNGVVLHQAIYSSKPDEYLAFISLYELVSNWKSSFVMINSKIIDRKIVGQLNYCYGDKCRSGNPSFCYGASYMTENPFGCHRLQVSAANNPWWSFYRRKGNIYFLDRTSLKQRIDSYAKIYNLCPCFDYNKIMQIYNSLPSQLTQRQLNNLQRNNFGLKM